MDKYNYIGSGKFADPERDIDTTILEVLKQYGPLARDNISLITQIPRTTIYDHLKVLEYKDRVERRKIFTRRRGTPKVVWEISEVK